jgi:hypothetical protein
VGIRHMLPTIDGLTDARSSCDHVSVNRSAKKSARHLSDPQRTTPSPLPPAGIAAGHS